MGTVVSRPSAAGRRDVSILNLLNHADYERTLIPAKGRPKTLLTDSQRVVGRHTSLLPSPLVERAGAEPASSAHAKGSEPLCSFTPPPQRNLAWDVVQVDHRLEAHPRGAAGHTASRVQSGC
jgi:hypothetical protein